MDKPVAQEAYTGLHQGLVTFRDTRSLVQDLERWRHHGVGVQVREYEPSGAERTDAEAMLLACFEIQAFGPGLNGAAGGEGVTAFRGVVFPVCEIAFDLGSGAAEGGAIFVEHRVDRQVGMHRKAGN